MTGGASRLRAVRPWRFCFLELAGMLIKNAIVLIDQIDLEIREGKAPYAAIVDSALSRRAPS